MTSKTICLFFWISLITSLNCYAQYTDVSLNSGIFHCHISPDLLGGGVGVLDINNDGLEDLYFTGGIASDKLFLNLGNLEFKDISYESNIHFITRSIRSTSVAIGDLNNDGLDDIFVTSQRGQPSVLAINQGDLTFTDVSYSSGLQNFTSWGMGAGMLDVNRDGLLDIYVINYIEEFNTLIENDEVVGFNHKGAPNYLFLNQGDLTFLESAETYGVNSAGCGLAFAITDLNADGYNDLFVINDFGAWVQPNEAFIFDPNIGVFNDNAPALGLNDSIYGMGVGVGDYNNDGDTDYYLTNIGENVLRSKSDTAHFSNVAPILGLQNALVDSLNTTGWGTLFVDVDNDGNQDLYIGNGPVGTADFLNTPDYGDRNKLYMNVDGQAFNDVSVQSQTDIEASTRGVVRADLNNDGFYDIITTNIERIRYASRSNVNIFINDSFNNNNNWTGLLLRPKDNSSALGSIIRVYSKNNIFSQELNSGGSHASASSKRVIFGLGTIEKIDSIKIKWPDLQKTTLKNIPINHYLEITQSPNQYIVLSCEEHSWGCPLSDPLAISNASGRKNVATVYPNLTNHLVNVILPEYPKSSLVQLFDLTGNLISEHNALANELIEVDLSKQLPGLYLLKIGIHSYKVIKN